MMQQVSHKALSAALEAHHGGMASFVRALRRDEVRYLSYSKVACVEFCRYRYYLEHIKGVKLRPLPSYFAKGRTLHKAAERMYRRIARGVGHNLDLEPLICRQHCGEEDRQHLRNAAQLLVDNAMADWEVLGVERPFVLPLGRGLPPCIGVVDLIVRKGGVIAIVDHKTGKTVGGGDPMQLAVYRQFVIRRHEAKEYLTRFDEYRWVNNLGRIRKPAFQRTEVALGPTDWASALERFREANRRIRQIEEDRDAAGNGECYMCPYRGVCKKASYATSW